MLKHNLRESVVAPAAAGYNPGFFASFKGRAGPQVASKNPSQEGANLNCH
jgi:hypothetical protein